MPAKASVLEPSSLHLSSSRFLRPSPWLGRSYLISPQESSDLQWRQREQSRSTMTRLSPRSELEIYYLKKPEIYYLKKPVIKRVKSFVARLRSLRPHTFRMHIYDATLRYLDTEKFIKIDDCNAAIVTNLKKDLFRSESWVMLF